MVQASPRTFVPMPSFGSVFGEEASSTEFKELSDRGSTGVHGGHLVRPASSGNTSNSVHFSSFHVHRDSRDSTSSASSDNSPTTTISTMDSSSVTDPSPGPSPESPIAKATPSSFVADFRSRRTDNNSSDSSPNTFFELQRPTTPAKKPRNLKNLGINTSSSLSNLRSNPTAPLPVVAKKEKNSSAPPSPSFIKPPTPPKRRPSNLSLTISTPGSNENKPMKLIIPATPALNRPALRHFQSSPSLPLCSPSVAPAGGMQLPTLRPIRTNPHGFSEVPIEMEEEDQEPNFDIPQSREEKPAAYPNGPICIYESGVYLYFEPTAEQAATFDVIVNVASEVKNPFTTPASDSQKDLDARRIDGPPAENVDFACLPERTKASSFDPNSSSPTTPKATPVLETVQSTELFVNGTKYKTPEYIHMPWEHNTDIVPDLHKLVKTMDERVQQGKRILVHCQCGVSRSASLIVAYGLYKNPGMSVQEAYDAVKKRSKWIGPNMNLIMQLQEFRNGLLRANETRSYQYGLNLPRRSAGLPTGVSTRTNQHSPFDREVPSGSRTPRTAPLPPDTDVNMQRASTGNMISISPGPLSAPSGLFSPGFRRSWASSQTNFDLSPKASHSATPYVDPKGHVVPVLSVTDNDRNVTAQDNTPQAKPAYSEQEASLKPLLVPNFSRQLPLRNQDADDGSQSVASPTSEDFHTAPLEPIGFDALRSPAVPSFNIPSLAPDHVDSFQLSSPTKAEFNINPWLCANDMETQPSPRSMEQLVETSPMSPTSTEFHMAGPTHDHLDPHGLPSPRSITFDHNTTQESMPPMGPNRSSGRFDVISPTATEFPKDIFSQSNDTLDVEMTSPRATEFHMTPLKPRVTDDDPFGLTSPTRFEFPGSPFDKAKLTPSRNVELESRRPSFQAILPPSHLEQPEAVNGFASLNSTAQAMPTIQAPEAPSGLDSKPFDHAGRMDSLHTSPDPQLILPVEPHTPNGQQAQVSPVTPRTSEHLFLSTPSRQTAIRTRFSSPNMREQRRLHKLQTEMEAMLPHRSPHPPQAVDDLDALMSPRAEEFTRNPFHMDLRSSGDDSSPASSNETIKDGQSGKEWKETRQWTPQKAEEDPRSPVQTGSSPIVRNIWDVL